ncbi:ATP-binding protein [Yersinia enterocolitica]|uniref:ATP-binding protein n=1 Tax=Yersinia enterocolitica TaxID=630 RepID=UPI0028DAAD4D|nr:ATP-binding protein [Yersinia enterocolitica]ELY5258275.1 ATP-binding protein [Yersinia enterocolitica]EMC5230372.1 ATP-binding protein [Yersinia enterocolitica]HDZ8859683.1 ATP-binding protein [Yersinia enterocolitica]HEA9984456.1 ATP-binding protein [Yersinia enterocolitica]
MNTAEHENIILRTGIDPTFLADTLTTDIELTDALFDLIDNSIDSARNEIVKNEYCKDEHGLPNNYKGYRIRVRFGSKSIIVEDNCIGIGNETLENSAFYTGKRSNHEYGIGHYGLGLKRALLKAGRTYAMITDNGDYLYKSNFNINSFASENESQLIARKYTTTNKRRTIFIVSDLYPNVISQISDSEWMANAINELSVRYSIFIRKGLDIFFINSQKDISDSFLIEPSVPNIRTDGLIKNIKDKLDTFTISCDFRVGIHEGYSFPGEWTHDAEKNKKLTKTYGIYYIFNDRVIVAASKEDKHGFITHWHSEYGGFVCIAHITGKDPKDLPWNTAKTEVKINNPLFLQIRKKIEPLAQEYRRQAKILINLWLETKDLPEEERKKIFEKQTTGKKLSDAEISAISRKDKVAKDANSTSQSTPIVKGNSKNSNQPKENETLIKTAKESKQSAKNNKNVHVKDWDTLLPEHFPVTGNEHILNNLIIEATSLKINDAPHASCMLYRSMFEAAFKHFVKANNLYTSVKEHYYSKGEGSKKDHSEIYRKQQGIDLSICSSWLLDNSDIFPIESKKKLVLCSKKIKSHIPTMNGVVHGNQVIGNDGQIQKIRNETIYLLEFLTLGKIFQ